MLREAGVDWERIFEIFYAMFEEKVSHAALFSFPFHTRRLTSLGLPVGPLEQGRFPPLSFYRHHPASDRLVSLVSRGFSFQYANSFLFLLIDRLAEWTKSQSPYAQRSASRFPVLQVEEFVTNSLLPVFALLDESDSRKQSLRSMKKALMASM